MKDKLSRKGKKKQVKRGRKYINKSWIDCHLIEEIKQIATINVEFILYSKCLIFVCLGENNGILFGDSGYPCKLS